MPERFDHRIAVLGQAADRTIHDNTWHILHNAPYDQLRIPAAHDRTSDPTCAGTVTRDDLLR